MDNLTIFVSEANDFKNLIENIINTHTYHFNEFIQKTAVRE